MKRLALVAAVLAVAACAKKDESAVTDSSAMAPVNAPAMMDSAAAKIDSAAAKVDSAAKAAVDTLKKAADSLKKH